VSRDGFEISSDPGRLDRALIHRFLHDESYWAKGVPRDVVDRAIDNSLCFGLYDPDGRQAGFARVVTDRAAIAYLADVFVLAEHRGRGLGKWLIETVMSHPELQGLRRFFLGTADAHALYERYGFRALADPDRMMEIAVPYNGAEA
jgi:ribosomal protein S18 acetylase RimI-like enzyme